MSDTPACFNNNKKKTKKKKTKQIISHQPTWPPGTGQRSWGHVTRAEVKG